MDLLSQLADATGTSEKVLIYTLIGGHVVTLLTLLIKAIVDQANRAQDRLDSESKARILLTEGAKREQRINDKIEENTQINRQAIDTANGHNEKIKAAVETVAEVAKGMVEKRPQEVHVTSEPSEVHLTVTNTP